LLDAKQRKVQGLLLVALLGDLSREHDDLVRQRLQWSQGFLHDGKPLGKIVGSERRLLP
jgi:hypothetical protein